MSENVTPLRRPFEIEWVDKVVERYEQTPYFGVTIYSQGGERVYLALPMEGAASLAMAELGLEQKDRRLWRILAEAAKMCVGGAQGYETLQKQRETQASRLTEIFGSDIDPKE